MAYNWNFEIIFKYKSALLQGMAVTFELVIISLLLGTFLGLLFYCLGKSNPTISYMVKMIVNILRGLPILIVIIWLFYAATPLLGITFNQFWSASIGISLVLGAFVSEIFRAGFDSIHFGQIDAAKVLGLSKFQMFKYIIFPQAMQVIIPPLTGSYMEAIKNTSLASVIAVNELLHQGNTIISATYRPLEVYTVVAIIYLMIIIPFGLLLRRFEQYYVKSRKPA